MTSGTEKQCGNPNCKCMKKKKEKIPFLCKIGIHDFHLIVRMSNEYKCRRCNCLDVAGYGP